MKTFAIIGSGFVGNLHMAALQKSDRHKLIALVEKDEEKAKAASLQFGVPWFTDAGEMLAKVNPDILDICLPSAFHEEFVLFAAKNKKNVICEKPFSLSVESCNRMEKACIDAGVHFMVGQVLRWFPEYMKIGQMLPKLGKLHGVTCYRLSQHPAWAAWYSDTKISGGGLYELHLHEIDYLYSLFGEAEHVYAAGWKSPSGCWDNVQSIITFKNGIKVSAEGFFDMIGNYPFSSGFRAVGENGTLEYKLTAGVNIENLTAAGNKITFYEKDKDPVDVTYEEADGFQLMLDAYADSIEEQRPVPIPPENSVHVIKIMDALYQSLETGKGISI